MIDERARHEMYLGLEEKLGTTVADAVMQHLPPVGWAEVANKYDLAALEARMDLRFDGLEARLELRIEAQINRLLYFLIPTIFTAIGLAIAVSKIS